MEKNKTVFCGIITVIVIIIFIFLISINNKKEDKSNDLSSENEITQLKEELGISGNDDIYTVSKEYDGRLVLAIKPEIQYNTVMAGIINKNKFDFEDINRIVKNAPDKTGIWISENSRNKFLDTLNSITNCNYIIDEKGYLKQEKQNNSNEYDKKIDEMIKSKNLYVIDINSKCYIVDDVTGNITEYPFEEMDYRIPFECFEFENKTIFILTNNEKGKLEYTNIIKEMIENAII